MNRRAEMLSRTIQKELGEMILRDLQDPRLTGLPSVTRVKLSPDYSMADIYVTVMGTHGQQTAALHALQHSAGMMRGKLTKSLSLRQAPYLRFHMDEGAKKEIEILELLKKVSEENAEIDRRRAEAAAAKQQESSTQEESPEQ